MRAFLSLGANLGDRRLALERAAGELERRGLRIASRSSVYETAPVGPSQPDYLNQVLEIETSSSPRQLLAVCLDVEAALGRDRVGEVRHGPRAIDVDVLLAGDAVCDDPDLTLPHPRLAERAFVVVPLAEIAPDLEVPGAGRVGDLARAVGSAGVAKLQD